MNLSMTRVLFRPTQAAISSPRGAHWLVMLTVSVVVLASLDLTVGTLWAQNTTAVASPESSQTSDEAEAGPEDQLSLMEKLPQTPEQKAEGDAAEAEFNAIRQQLAEALLEMKSTYIRYQNDEDQSPAARANYRKHRDRTRDLMRELYDAADHLLTLRFHEHAITYVGTSIQHREKHDIYDESTMRGSTKLIDSGARELFLFSAAARSAIAVGEFSLAKRIYETIEDDQMKDVDRSLFYQIDKLEEQWTRELERRKQDAQNELPRVRLKTTRGDAVLELFLDSAPSTVAHFIQLVEDGFYDGLDFSQVMDHLLALTGDSSGDGRGHSGQFLLDEHQRDDARHGFRGSLVMAKVPIPESPQFVANSASSQFVILFLPVPTISEQQTVFGRVIEGMDVISSLRRVNPSEKKKDKQVMVPPDRILSAEVIRKPENLPEPKYLDLDAALEETRRSMQKGYSEAER